MAVEALLVCACAAITTSELRMGEEGQQTTLRHDLHLACAHGLAGRQQALPTPSIPPLLP